MYKKTKETPKFYSNESTLLLLRRKVLHFLENTHIPLCHYAKEISKFYSLPIFFCIIYVFIMIVSTCYLIFSYIFVIFFPVICLCRNATEIKNKVLNFILKVLFMIAMMFIKISG